MTVPALNASGFKGFWAKVVRWASNDLCRGSRESLAEAVGSPDVLVSCVGAVGFDRQGLRQGNGVANAELARVVTPAPATHRGKLDGRRGKVVVCESDTIS